MKTFLQLLCRLLLPAPPPPSQLAAHMTFFNAPRIYMPSGGDERIRNRTLPQGNCLNAGKRTPGDMRGAMRRGCH